MWMYNQILLKVHIRQKYGLKYSSCCSLMAENIQVDWLILFRACPNWFNEALAIVEFLYNKFNK